MIFNQVPELIRDKFDWPLNVHGKTRPKSLVSCFLKTNCKFHCMTLALYVVCGRF